MMLEQEFELDGALAALKRLSDLGFNAVEISPDSHVGSSAPRARFSEK
jgi:ribonuclease HI